MRRRPQQFEHRPIRMLLDGGTLGSLFESIISADEVRRPKPDPSRYWRALERSGVPAPSACFVAAHAWDIQGAAAVGLSTIWISRLEKAWSVPSGPAGRTLGTLKEIPASVADIARGQAVSSG